MVRLIQRSKDLEEATSFTVGSGSGNNPQGVVVGATTVATITETASIWCDSKEGGVGGLINDGTGTMLLTQLKLSCDVANQGAFDCRNANALGIGQNNIGGNAGLVNTGTASGSTGQTNEGDSHGFVNVGDNGRGIYCIGNDFDIYAPNTNIGWSADLNIGGNLNVYGGIGVNKGVSIIAEGSSNNPAVSLTGDGTGPGLAVQGGANADGIRSRSGVSSGYGICFAGAQGGGRMWGTTGDAVGLRLQSTGSGDGLEITGSGNGPGINVQGGATAAAVRLYGGSSSGCGVEMHTTSGPCVFLEADSGNGIEIYASQNAIDVYANGNAVYLQSSGDDAVAIYPGANSIGVNIWGGYVSGEAVKLSTQGSGGGVTIAGPVNLPAYDAEPTGPGTTFMEILRWFMQRFWAGSKSATEIKVKKADGTVISTQAITSSGSDETLGPPA